MVPLIYIASPLGFSEVGRDWYYKVLIPAVERCGFEVIDPWKLTDPRYIKEATNAVEGSARTGLLIKANRIIGMNNRDGIKRCQLLLAVLDGSAIDSGVAGAIGFAAGIGKPIEGYRSDFDLASDNAGCAVNPQVQYFIEMLGGFISPSLDALDEVLRVRVRGFNRDEGSRLFRGLA